MSGEKALSGVSVRGLANGLLLGFAILCMGPEAARAESFGPFGLALKIGESAGGFGAQASYNLSARWQLNAGVGGAGIPYIVEYGAVRTDSYFLMGRHYLRHLFFATGYSHKRTRVEHQQGGILHREAASAHGIPAYLGYELSLIHI